MAAFGLRGKSLLALLLACLLALVPAGRLATSSTALAVAAAFAGSGAGLGLAIVTDIAEAWNGWLSIRNIHEGGATGLEVRLHLPRADIG